MGHVVAGTCSWTEKTMIERWYPHGVSSAEERLRYYASRFDTVEVDSSFYAIPRREYAEAWARRTPPGFIFHVKAFGMMTGHEVDERALPPEMRDVGYEYTVTSHGRVRSPEARMVDHSFEIFSDAIQPLREAGRMGGVLLQYPPWYTARDREETERVLGRIDYAIGQLSPVPVFVEFRHSSWAEERTLEKAARFLAERGAGLVAVDAPRVGDGSSMPPVSVATGPLGYVRFHGRNAATWGMRTASAADRFDYLYSDEELAEWVQPIRRLAEQTERTWVMFNNCKYDYAPRNAARMAEILGDVIACRSGGARTGEPVAPLDPRDGRRVADACDGYPESGEQLGLGI